ncbi:hypothetical protein Q3G72_015030 [Acer saccharum]|nr:hypothetical protein Q3G72_015030 [Acer saccharum]
MGELRLDRLEGRAELGLTGGGVRCEDELCPDSRGIIGRCNSAVFEPPGLSDPDVWSLCLSRHDDYPSCLWDYSLGPSHRMVGHQTVDHHYGTAMSNPEVLGSSATTPDAADLVSDQSFGLAPITLGAHPSLQYTDDPESISKLSVQEKFIRLKITIKEFYVPLHALQRLQTNHLQFEAVWAT